jgi:hypothetical protein
VGRALLPEFVIPARERDTMTGLCKATYSLMGYTLSLLLYGMAKTIATDGIRSMVAEMITDAVDMLWEEPMFKEGHDVRFHDPARSDR